MAKKTINLKQCNVKEGMKQCTNGATSRIEVLPHIYYYMCPKHFAQYGQAVLDASNLFRENLKKQIREQKKEKK